MLFNQHMIKGLDKQKIKREKALKSSSHLINCYSKKKAIP